ncbi:putative RNA-binding Zn ribbon-like protein [Catenulispora sp. MAP12-49]|uniref:CGNR zinc finger domain-containing protein n=1 Tax=Catenulispora sp. MAP12-49 TaxID=3156302 RepID=UPI0035170D8B
MDETAARHREAEHGEAEHGAAAQREWMLAEEGAPIALMATIWADTAGLHDSLTDTEDLTAFCDAVTIEREGTTAGEADLELARQLRDALRRLAAQVTADDRQQARSATADVETAVHDVNNVLANLPAPRLALAGGKLRQSSTSGASSIAAGLAHIAEDAIGLLTGPDADKLRACHAPGCVLYFVKTHPRREWCSVTCGNRVRAARHYEKVRSAR